MASGPATTLPSPAPREDGEEAPFPRLVAVWAGGRPVCLDRRVGSAGVAVGRGGDADLVLDDGSVSRVHARIGFDGACWTVRDHESRNGTFVDGRRIRGEVVAAQPRVIRLGDALLVPLGDLGGPLAPPEVSGTRVVGARLRQVWATIGALAGISASLYIRGESGSGKELAARELHRCARPRGPFVAVNAAAIPETLAEALLFGARRGAFSGAVEASEGYLRAADGGVLFLDEVGELSAALQGKLLRALEARAVVPVGETRAHPVDLHLCVATHHDLRERVRSGQFREDLYYRVARPMVELPALRQRPEDLPWLIAAQVAEIDPSLRCTPALIEACLLRPWPGNVRELVTEIRVAAHRARTAGRRAVDLGDLAAGAGEALVEAPAQLPAPAAPPSPGQRRRLDANKAAIDARRGAIEAALRAARGNVSEAARLLGVHRTQLRRWVTHLAIDPDAFA